MSGDTVKGNALQFTNDNKRAYAYSGDVTVTGSESTPQALLNFNTNSEYVEATIQFTYSQESSQRGFNSIQFNNITIVKQFFRTASGTYDETFPMTFEIIIPPFTDVKCLTGFEDSSGKQCVTVIGKVGMPPRVGNLVE